ncbi:ferric-dicitrate binding protein FerR, regulates iron transport through sigma-19 [Parapedobacter composti]|uniref:Ferric-dicitrate binding protein FerR, regulates iron transport through sigma-19 n=1 Tax=Parapedobacter composti TaxID=623281 RepID=A0A1I1H7F7_9SPHI|nr:FecR domain-containing protein [Parapedobacter composti]SFC19645.1 ferric-dicitrate binding protein FerR, regulates iron transport through sigma-19 [Parapedobacter composti]
MMDDALLTKYLLNEASEAEAAAVRQWIAADPAHERHFRHMRLIWETSQSLASGSGVDEDEAWRRFVQRRDSRPKGYRLGWVRIAAMLLLVPIAGLAGFYLLGPGGGGRFASTYATADAPSTDTLADGSVITLNRFAELDFSQSPFKRERTVDLHKGEAFFRVAPDGKKPFVIRSGDVTVTVVGTSFNVKRRGDETTVIVESGKVNVAGLNQTAELGPGQKVTVNTRTGRFEEGWAEDRLHHYYVNRRLVLDNTPLWRIAEVLEEAYGVDIAISRKEIGELPMSTTLRLGPLDEVLNVVAQTLGVQVERTGKRVVIR